MARITETVKVLLIANVLFFIGSQLIGDQAIQLLALWFPGNDNFGVWQIVTHMFMHANFMHILFNMFALYMFGSLLERSIGQNRFLFLYFSAGLGAAGLQILFSYLHYHHGYQALLNGGMSPTEIQDLLHNAFSQALHGNSYRVNIPQGIDSSSVTSMIDAYSSPMVGASGAIFGVMAAFAVVYPNLPLYLMFIPVPIKAKYLIGGYFLITVYSAVSGTSFFGPSNTAYWAHIGGAVIGFITMWYWKKNQFNENRWN